MWHLTSKKIEDLKLFIFNNVFWTVLYFNHGAIVFNSVMFDLFHKIKRKFTMNNVKSCQQGSFDSFLIDGHYLIT